MSSRVQFVYGAKGITFQAFNLLSVVISIFMDSQYPALSGPFIASCHLGLSDALTFAASARGFHHFFHFYNDLHMLLWLP